MKKSIKHLPKRTQEELTVLLDLVCKSVDNCQMIILFGSYARGNYVLWDTKIEFGVRTSYQSDYDILVITNGAVKRAERKLERITNKYHDLFEYRRHAFPQFIVEHINTVNNNLEVSQYFFTPAGALGAVCLKVPEKRPEKDGSRIMGDGPPCLDGLGIADFPGFRNVRASGGKFRHAFSGVRQGGKAVHAALFHCDIIRAQIPFLIGPNTDTPDFGQQDSFPVQWPPVPEYMKIRHLFLIHEPGNPCTPDRGLFPEHPGVGPGRLFLRTPAGA